jgi:hypothetical protein
VTEPSVPNRDSEPSVSLHSRIVQAGGVLAALADGELLLIHEHRDDCYALRGIGVEVWEAAGQPIRVEQICEALLRTYAVDRETCERSVLETVHALLGEGLFVCAA